MPGTFATTASLAALVFVPMAIEARRAAMNEQTQFRRGGVQPAADVCIYQWMRVVYPGAFIAMLAESALRGDSPRSWLLLGLTVFAVAKAIKWWAILTLGPFWTFRVVVVPGSALADGGPYRFLRHPNYLGVVGELAGMALMTGAAVCGPLAIVLFGVLLKRRISVEDRALASSARQRPGGL